MSIASRRAEMVVAVGAKGRMTNALALVKEAEACRTSGAERREF